MHRQFTQHIHCPLCFHMRLLHFPLKVENRIPQAMLEEIKLRSSTVTKNTNVADTMNGTNEKEVRNCDKEGGKDKDSGVTNFPPTHTSVCLAT